MDPTYNPLLDTLLGVLLALVSLVGAAFNITSFTLFLKHGNNERGNSRVFSRLFMLISLNDACICLALFPFIQVTLTPNRGVGTSQTVLFEHHLFCGGFTVVWWTLSQLSVLYVSLLSLTRLTIMLSPQRRLNIRVILWTPLCFVVLFGGTWVLLHSRGLLTSVYRPGLVICVTRSAAVHQQHLNTSGTLTREDMKALVMHVGLLNVMPTLFFLLIMTSFIWCLERINRIRDISSSRRSKLRSKQHRANVTVVLVTLLYLLLNIPLLCCVWVLFTDTFRLLQRTYTQELKVQEYLNYWELGGGAVASSSVFTKNYIHVLVFQLSISINSLLNPVVYLCRIKRFRTTVINVLSSIYTAPSSPPNSYRSEAQAGSIISN